MILAKCPHCQTMIDVGPHPAMGTRIRCPSCNTELEVVWLYPVELDLPEQGVNQFQGELESS